MKTRFSRRSLLLGAGALGLTPILARLTKLFPEAGVLVNGNESLPGFLQMPKDVIVRSIEGEEASRLLAEALGDADVLALRAGLPAFQPVPAEARIASATWSGGTQSTMIVAIPFTSKAGAEAALFYGLTAGVSKSLMVEFPDPAQRAMATIHSITEGGLMSSVAARDALESPSSASTCTPSCIINCLPGYGCNGLAGALCVGAITGCAFLFLPSCIAAGICTIWCGYAVTQCTSLCCGSSGGGTW